MLPCMLPPSVTNAALDELVAYHRIKASLYNVCPTCVEQRKKEKKRCYICGRLYDDEGWEEPLEGEQDATVERLAAMGAVNVRTDE